MEHQLLISTLLFESNEVYTTTILKNLGFLSHKFEIIAVHKSWAWKYLNFEILLLEPVKIDR